MSWKWMAFCILSMVLLVELTAASEITCFSPNSSTEVCIRVNDEDVSYEIFEMSGAVASKKIVFQSEEKLHIEVSDYNFDGQLDFSVWHIDEGMGVYKIYRIFLYSPKIMDFVDGFPACGDEFINVEIDKRRKAIVGTYFRENIPVSCFTQLRKFMP
ncbi:hypothetical protein P3W85_03515 [Cupriavidus basilensis]|uniref:Uncharacterized protein n=1 Tax=Cupriavidus basilensis TaxID=68895 RepID=A0ABT6AHD8_9BURK|nr:hypothetical protein [Cupriavidus basilensis]MDF3832026.1 hypothetical protein [Cupriavidus basilensis]